MFVQSPASLKIISFCLLITSCSKTLSETDATNATNAADAGQNVLGPPAIASTESIGLGSQHDRRRTEELQRRIEKQSFIDEKSREEAGNIVDAADQADVKEERQNHSVKNQERLRTAETLANDLFIRAQYLTAERRAAFDSAWQIYEDNYREAFLRLQSIEASSVALEPDAKPELERRMAQLEESVKNVGEAFSTEHDL